MLRVILWFSLIGSYCHDNDICKDLFPANPCLSSASETRGNGSTFRVLRFFCERKRSYGYLVLGMTDQMAFLSVCDVLGCPWSFSRLLSVSPDLE